MATFEYVLPVIRGIQAGQEYYVSMCPLRLLKKLFSEMGQEALPQKRSQRLLNPSRVPKIARYILDNPKEYTFSAITATIDGDIAFEPVGSGVEGHNIGKLRVPMEARLAITDGQHRRAALELALQENPQLGDETIALVLFLEIGLRRSQQVFSDLNRYGIRPSPSLNILYDYRDRWAILTRAVVEKVEVFAALTELERSNISLHSRKLFTLSSIYRGTVALLADRTETLEVQTELAAAFWQGVSRQIGSWQAVLQAQVSAQMIRQEYLHTHAIALVSLGKVGAVLLSIYPQDWEQRLDGLQQVNWSRQNGEWQGRAIFNGRIALTQTSIGLVTAYLKQVLGLPLTPAEEQLETTRRLAGWQP